MLAKINAALAWLKSRLTNSNMVGLKEKERPNLNAPTPGKVQLWIPFARQIENGMGFQGTYKGGYPKGAVIHYTAGRFKGGIQKAIETMQGGKKNGFTFLVISEDGEVVQGFPLNKWGWHAGQSSHPRLEGSVSDELIGIEICNAGLLERRGDKFFAWYGLEIPRDQVRTVTRPTANQRPGSYHKYTKDQEDSLIALLLWLKRNNPVAFSFDLVLGHDEVSPGRKTDPGGSLSVSMPELREELHRLWLAEQMRQA